MTAERLWLDTSDGQDTNKSLEQDVMKTRIYDGKRVLLELIDGWISRRYGIMYGRREQDMVDFLWHMFSVYDLVQ